MAGERFHAGALREVSGVCTHPDHQGQGFARLLVSEVMAGIRRDSNRPFLHVMPGNTGALRLYESMGFVRRVDVSLTVVRTSG